MNNNFIHHSLNSKDEILSWKLFLSHYSLESINQHFENYKALCHLDSINPNRIETAIKSLYKIAYNGGYFSPFFKNNNKPKIRPVSSPYYFFRIRKLTKESWIEFGKDGINFDAMEFEEIQTMADIWERPAEQVDNYQRLNKPHASVLYTSLMSSTAILETRLKEKELFFLLIYKSAGNFSYSDCCNFLYISELSEEENMKRYIIFYLLRDEFTRILPDSYQEGNQYCAAYFISKQFFVNEETQAIQYPSTRGLGHKNFAFWGNIRDYLEFVGLRFCRIDNKEGTQSKLSVIADCLWNNESKTFEYFSPHSEKSKNIFGDMSLSTMLQK